MLPSSSADQILLLTMKSTSTTPPQTNSSEANSPLHVKVNDLANAIDKESVNRIVKVYPM